VRTGTALLHAPSAVPGTPHPPAADAADGADAPGGGTAPSPASLVRLPGRPPDTYRRAMARSRVLLAWEAESLEDPADLYRLDIVDLHPSATPGADTMTYRLSVNGAVVFAGDDIDVPAGTPARDTGTVRALVTMLRDPPVPPTRRQRDLLERRGDDLASLVVDVPAPFPPGTRIETRLPGGRTATGTVVHATGGGAGGRPTSYAWTPDRDTLPGAPLHPAGGPRGWLVSPAADVRATLLPAETGLDGADPHLPLAYGATVSHLADDGAARRGTVLTAARTEAGLMYTVDFAGPGNGPAPGGGAGPAVLDARDVTPVRGTAWQTPRDILRARTAAGGPPPRPGELLSAGGRCVRLDTAADGGLAPRPVDPADLANPAGAASPAGPVPPTAAGTRHRAPVRPDAAPGPAPASAPSPRPTPLEVPS
jgi:hypothetical protein